MPKAGKTFIKIGGLIMIMALPRKVKETAKWKRDSGEFSVIVSPQR